MNSLVLWLVVQILHDFRDQCPINSGSVVYIRSCMIFTINSRACGFQPTPKNSAKYMLLSPGMGA